MLVTVSFCESHIVKTFRATCVQRQEAVTEKRHDSEREERENGVEE